MVALNLPYCTSKLNTLPGLYTRLFGKGEFGRLDAVLLTYLKGGGNG